MILVASCGTFSSVTLNIVEGQQAVASSSSSSNSSLDEANPNTFTITVSDADEVISESYKTNCTTEHGK
jgi:hypothetical protein